VGAKLRLCAEPFVSRGTPDENESAHDFFTRRLGAEAVQWLVGPFISGIYGGDPKRLGARDAFFKMYNWEKEGGSLTLGAHRFMKAKRKERQARGYPCHQGLLSFKGGLGGLIAKLEAALGEDLHTSEGAEAIVKNGGEFVVTTARQRYTVEHVVVAVPPPEARTLLAPLSADMGELLGEVEMAPMALIHLALEGEEAARIPQAFGFLVPRNQNLRLLGCLFPSRMFPEHAPADQALLACYVGGVFDPAALELDDASLLDIVRTELGGLLGHELHPVFSRVRKVPTAIPQLTPGHRARMARLNELASQQGGLVLAGNYLTGVGVGDACDSGLRAAERLLKEGA
jgi:oxygen-dependent protoporphyrinogen oxidase